MYVIERMPGDRARFVRNEKQARRRDRSRAVLLVLDGDEADWRPPNLPREREAGFHARLDGADDLLKQLDSSYQSPRPRHEMRDLDARALFRTNALLLFER